MLSSVAQIIGIILWAVIVPLKSVSKTKILNKSDKDILLVNRVSDDILQPYVEATGHYEFKGNALSAGRRNHDCIIHKGEAIFFGGRHNIQVETRDLQSGKIMLSPNFSTFNVNHLFGVPLKDHNGKLEIWIPCGFRGHKVNKELGNLQKIIILKRNGTGSEWLPPIEGPRVDKPVGACAALPLYIDGPKKPAHVCKFGGSAGTHDKGVFSRTVSCYDRAKKKWHALPSLPFGVDHLNAVYVPPGACNHTAHGRVLLFNFRDRPYGQALSKFLVLDLRARSDGRISFSNTSRWYELDATKVHSNHCGDAAGVATAGNGRYIITFGGIKHKETNQTLVTEIATGIRVFDVCVQRWFLSPLRMRDPRFALAVCNHNDRPIICGGTYVKDVMTVGLDKATLGSLDDNENLSTCEVFDSEKILENLIREEA